MIETAGGIIVAVLAIWLGLAILRNLETILIFGCMAVVGAIIAVVGG